ncbi:MAG: diaminopimelate decarboxylase [bacterium]|nr:diaminopimelate decarboxylase [bacterium]
MQEYEINQKGNFCVGGADVTELAQRYGTPLYVYDENVVRGSIRAFKKSMEDNYDGNGMVLYASKAFSCKEIYRIAQSEGIGADVVSAGELYTALSAGFSPENIFFHGNNKTQEEIEFAVKNNVGCFVVDNIFELKSLSRIAEQYNKRVRIMFRIKPGIDAHTHDFVRTGQIDSKFGFALETGEAKQAVLQALSGEYPGIELIGLHCHIGSQIFDVDPFCLAAEVMLDFMIEMKKETGVTLGELNLGGGFGIRYTDDDSPRPYGEYMGSVSKVIKNKCLECGFPTPKIYIEPGRSIIAQAGTTLYKVGAVKNIPNVRTYVSIDGGMVDNPRYILYGSKYDLLIANKASQQKSDIVTVAGKCCESGDLIQENVKLQPVEVGDILAVLATGAYNYSMASNYNRICRPAAVMVKDGQARVIIKRESFEDLVRNDV